MNLYEAICDPNLFEPWFRGPSWFPWRIVLKAACGLRLDEVELAIFRLLAERDPPASWVRELWVIAGRRAGKGSIGSSAATFYSAIPDYRSFLRPGEVPLVMCLAVDRPQARIVRDYAGAYFDNIQLLRPLKSLSERRDGFNLTNGVELAVQPANYRSVRGRTSPFAIFDEVAFWRDAESASPDVEIYNAVMPAMATMPRSLLMGISTPYRRAGLLYERYRRYFGVNDPNVLVIKAPSMVLNPSLDGRARAEAFEQDPSAAAAEWDAEWRTDIESFLDRQRVELSVVKGRTELPPQSGPIYFAFLDPSGGSADSMSLCIAHRDEQRGIVDLVREWRPPFSPEAVVKDAAETMHRYGVHCATGDRYGGCWVASAFLSEGISYVPSERTKGDIYREFLPLLNSGRVELLDAPRVITQFCGLERRVSRSGKDSIDHMPGGHDDLANAVAGAVVNTIGDMDVLEMYRRLGATS